MAKNVYIKKRTWKQDFAENWGAYVLFIPTFLVLFLFCYLPMFGIIMAFEDYRIVDGFFGSDWVWFDNFVELFTGDEFLVALRNTVAIGLLKLTLGFIAPIIFALLLSQLRNRYYKRVVQTMSYLPNFIASMVVCTLLIEFFGEDGPVTMLFTLFGAENQNWLANDSIPVFWLIYTFMGIWQGIGWGSIMYVATIATVNGDLYEAAALDGANRWKMMMRITLPSILPMIVMMFIMQIGLCFSQGYDNILLLYMPSTYSVSDTIYTYTYRIAGFGTSGGSPDYGLSAASGLFQSVVSTALLVSSNQLSKKKLGMSLY